MAEAPGGSWASLESGRFSSLLTFGDKTIVLKEDLDGSKPPSASSLGLEKAFWKVLPDGRLHQGGVN